MSISDSRIDGNRAVKGGGLASNNANTTLTNVVLVNNTATQTGGGVYMSAGVLSIVGCTLEGNNAGTDGNGDGGAVNISNGQVQIQGATLRGNHAEGNGGAILARECDLTLNYCTFTDNTAGRKGPNVAYLGILDGTQLPGQEPNTWVRFFNCTGLGNNEPEQAQ